MRRTLYLAHLYLGLSVGLLVVLVGLTGSAVVYRPEIERLLNPEWFRVQPNGETRPLDDLIANAVATYPYGKPTFVSIQPPLAPDEPAMVVMKNRFGAGSGPWVRAHLDPYSGAAIASFIPEETFSGFLFQLHTSLLVGEHSWGEQLVGAFGILLFFFCLTGVILWWPGLGRLRHGFKVRAARGAVILNYDLHRVIGIIFIIPLLLVALTGIVLVFPLYTKAPIVKAFGIKPPPKAPQTSGGTSRISLERLRSLIARDYPAARLMGITVPGKPKDAYQVRLLLPGDSKIRYGGGAKLAVWIDPATGEILKEHDARSMPASSRMFFEWIFPTHTGDIAGEAGRFLAFLTGIIPLALFVTGFCVWYYKRARVRATSDSIAFPKTKTANRRRASFDLTRRSVLETRSGQTNPRSPRTEIVRGGDS